MKKLLFLSMLFVLFATVGYSQEVEGDHGKTYYDAEKTKPKETYSYKEVYKMVPGQPKPEISYVKHGPYFYYYESGKLKISGQYKDGEKHGEWKYYDEKGKLIKTEKYENGKLVQ